MSAGPASATPPGNDARSAPQAIGALPATIRATTVEATLEPDEPFSGCGRALKGSVWFSFTAATARSVLLAFDAAGDMDAAVDVFLRQRSQLTPVDCRLSDARGEATIDVDVAEGANYLVRVAPLSNSVADAFSLLVVEPDRPAQPPGPRLAASGVAATVDRFANPDDAWSTTLQQGRTYRLNFVTKGDGCAAVAVYRPGLKSFGGSAVVERTCDAHVVFAAPESGRYSIHVRAPRASRLKLPYRLRVGVALADDTAPGIRLLNDRAVNGSLTGSELDALDLYRFSVVRRSDLRLRLRTKRDLQLTLLTAGGRRLGSGSFIDRRMKRGRYYVAVRALDGADGSYSLKRVTRTITSARTLVDRQRSRTVPAGRSVVLSVAVRPSVSGRASMLVERFDPIDGWLFYTRFHPAVVGGRASVTFRPPTVGRWRVTGDFDGTRTASPSAGGTATLLVTEPLTG
ncbi:MAG: hypothetical protein ACRDWY_01920 [Actinomycetes bacterium]